MKKILFILALMIAFPAIVAAQYEQPYVRTQSLYIGGTQVTSTAAELNALDGITSTVSELNILDGVTSTAAELNILDGVTSTASELNILDGVTRTSTEINAMPITVATVVDASGGGTATETNCALIPAGSLLLNVLAVVDVAFNGDTTQTLEVGVSGNIDNYIDTSDFDPSAAAGTAANSLGGTTNDQTLVEYLHTETQLVATWTNTASASAGQATVYATYIELP